MKKKRFRCGRLILMRDGTIKKLDLQNGGGTRFCNWYSNKMTFKDVHHRLLDIFRLNNREYRASLYDFEYRPINVQQYKTFRQYINKYGLTGNSTAVYLCTHQDDNDIPMNSITSLIPYGHVVKNKPYLHRHSFNRSSCEYSFTNASNNLMKNVRKLINENGLCETLIQLFENICIIHGYVFSILFPLQQQSQRSNQSEVTIYLNNLMNIYEIFESTKTLLHRNMSNFRHIRIYSTIRSEFFQFYNNVQILRNRWLNNVGNKNNRINTTSSSLTRSDIESTSEDDHQINRTKSSQVLPSTSSLRKSSNEETNKQFSLFLSILKHLQHLLHLLQPKRLSTFRELISLSIRKTKSIRLNINLLDESSVCDAKQAILSIKDQFKNNFGEQDISLSKFESDPIVYEACNNTLRAIRLLLTSLNRYETQI